MHIEHLEPRTWYHVLVVRHLDGRHDAYFDTSHKAANLPEGTTLIGRMGSVRTNDKGELIPFQVQDGWWSLEETA